MAQRKPRTRAAATVADVPDELLPSGDLPHLLRLTGDGVVGDLAAWRQAQADRREALAEWMTAHGVRFRYPELTQERRRRAAEHRMTHDDEQGAEDHDRDDHDTDPGDDGGDDDAA